jgi:hypothetical protein
MGRCLVVLIVRGFPLIGLVAALALVMFPALGRDVDGRYKDAPLHEWFNHLASRNGLCCSFADGYVVEDADWMSENGHYRVRVPKVAGSKDMIWVEVPDEPSSLSRTRLGGPWSGHSTGARSVSIRCFMPGSMI